MPESNHADETTRYVQRHLRLGWWAILGFLTLGLALELMHGFKLGWYLNVSNETRRLMWRLAHAHGVLLGLLNVAYACSLGLRGAASQPLLRPGRGTSRLLKLATFLLPGGFFLGGTIVHGGDPSLLVLIVPVGAACLFLAVLGIARGTGGTGGSEPG